MLLLKIHILQYIFVLLNFNMQVIMHFGTVNRKTNEMVQLCLED